MRIIYLSVTFCCLLSVSLKAQLLEYQKVIEAPESKPSVIIERVNKWAGTTFTSYQAVFQYKDTTTLALTPALSTVFSGGKGLSFYAVNNQYTYNLTIEARQGRLRVTIGNFKLASGKTSVYVREVMLKSIADSKLPTKQKAMQTDSWNREYDQIDKEINRMITQIEAAAKVPAKNKDW